MIKNFAIGIAELRLGKIKPARICKPKQGWAVADRNGYLFIDTVAYTRRETMKLQAAKWEPTYHVPDWHEKTLAWQWRWIKNRFDHQIVKVTVSRTE